MRDYNGRPLPRVVRNSKIPFIIGGLPDALLLRACVCFDRRSFRALNNAARIARNIKTPNDRVSPQSPSMVLDRGDRGHRAGGVVRGHLPRDMGETPCKVPVTSTDVEKYEASGRVGNRRATIR